MSSTFLPAEEVVELTGKAFKSQQITQLRKMGINFLVNATGHPVVPRAQFDRPVVAEKPAKTRTWIPQVLMTR
jgi:hypothetical protein